MQLQNQTSQLENVHWNVHPGLFQIENKLLSIANATFQQDAAGEKVINVFASIRQAVQRRIGNDFECSAN